MKMKEFTTVIFDMDGLLIDSEPLWGEAMKEIFADMDIRLKPEHYAYTTGLRTSEVVDFWYHHFGWEGKTPVEVADAIVKRVTDKIMEKGNPMDGLEYILSFFSSRNYKIGLASSSPMILILSVLEHLKVKHFFQAIYSAEHEDYGKPHPAVYLSCARELESLPLRCIVFEDSVNGLIAGKAARMKTVVVPEKHNRNDPRYILADLILDSLADFTEESLKQLQEKA